jgi:hypothetical protein
MEIPLLGMLFLVSILTIGDIGRAWGQEPPVPSKGFAGCVQPEQVDGSPQLNFKNSCAQNMEFTISWSGAHTARSIKYRIGGNGTRKLNKADEHWSFLGEGPAAFGNGPDGKVSVVEQPTNVQDLYKLLFHNEHQNYTLADVLIKLYFPPPNTTVSTIHRQVVLEPNGMYFCCFFDKTVFAKYEVSQAKAEDDPQ